jgi:hypothetical protein
MASLACCTSTGSMPLIEITRMVRLDCLAASSSRVTRVLISL